MNRKVWFSVPFNGDIELIDFLPTSVAEVYGKLTNDGFYGGRAGYSLLKIERDTLTYVVSSCMKRGIKFNYLLNAPFQGSDQFSSLFFEKLAGLLGFLIDIGVWGITVSAPHVARFSKRHFPELSISISKFARVNSIPRLKLWENVGIDQICIDGNLTKRPKLIQLMASASNVPLVMLCNDACIEDCAFENCHAIYEGVHSNDQGSTYLSYFSTFCKQIMAQDKTLILRSTFIRPNDIRTYSKWGVSVFKLVDRNRPTWWITRVVDAYTKGLYEGNLADLLSLFSFIAPNFEKKLEITETMSGQEVQLLKKRGALDLPIYINNTKLNGYIQELDHRSCDQRDRCDECGYCDKLAENAITFLKGYNKFIKNANAIINKFSGH